MSCSNNNLLTCSTITNETNNRIYNRNIPSQPLQPYLDVRPVMTKYSIMPIVDPRKENKVKLNQLPNYNVHNVFNPGNTQSPWSGYNVNNESILRNQIFALQKCSQTEYVPNSNSDLYKWSFKPSTNTKQTHELLFQETNFNDFDPNPDKLGFGLFHNATRVQLKDLTSQTTNVNK
jgi:hypothetical protein